MASPAKQARISQFFQIGDTSEAVPEIRLEVLPSSNETVSQREEAHWREVCADTDRPYVKNGSRDRWGNLRKNVGCRPKKQEIPGKKRQA